MERDRRQINTNKQKENYFQSRSTHSEDHDKWTKSPSQSESMKSFRKLQLSILTLFTSAKNNLASIYKNTTTSINKIALLFEKCQSPLVPQFQLTVCEIEDQISKRMDSLLPSMESMLIKGDQIEKLSSCFQEQTKKSFSRKNISSTKSLKNIRNSNDILTDLKDLNQADYTNIVKIALAEKRCQDYNWLIGKWDSLQILQLDNKNITTLIPLRTFSAEKLKQISLTSNEIASLDFLKGVYFPQLIKLNLKNNVITKIVGLEEADMPSLKFLNLSYNKIKNLSTLPQTYFPKLVQLSLSNNRLDTVAELVSCDFPCLQVINIDKNNIGCLKYFSETKFQRLKILSFCYNKIKSIQFLRKSNFPQLEGLLAYNNQIKEIIALRYCRFPLLKELMLNNNLIQDISVISKIQFPELRQFDMQNNKIKNNEMFCFVTKTKSLAEAKKRFPFMQI